MEPKLTRTRSRVSDSMSENGCDGHVSPEEAVGDVVVVLTGSRECGERCEAAVCAKIVEDHVRNLDRLGAQAVTCCGIRHVECEVQVREMG